MPVLQTFDLVKHYRLGNQTVCALNSVSLDVEPGAFIAITGRSGSGKTTLLSLIGCLDLPTSGTIILNGKEVSKLPERDLPRVRRNEIGFVFQRFYLIPTLSAFENVMLPLKYSRVNGRKAKDRALEMLGAVDMAERLQHRPMELSGGEQQRVAIARALVNRPSLVLADEPTGELDTESGRRIIDLMMDLSLKRGQTFLVATHDADMIRHARSIIRLEDGKIKGVE